MKIVLVLVSFLLVGCSIMLEKQPTVPKGYKPCSSDYDCLESQYCGFIGVDTYAVCRD